MPLPFIPNKRLGQHFLTDTNLAATIVGLLEAPSDAPVVEIGPGTGALTRHLVLRFQNVTAIEVDRRAVVHLNTSFPDLRVLHADVLTVDWDALAAAGGAPLHVIGNLPYNITSPILFGLLEHRQSLREAILMMQREVALRLVAPRGTKAYGIPSVLAQLYAAVELLRTVPRTVFVPKPAVESAIIRLRFDQHTLPDANHSLLRAVVHAAFGQRRKMLHNSLHAWTRKRGITLPADWGRLRAEDLDVEDFVALARHIDNALNTEATR